jgi:hypothetical protein
MSRDLARLFQRAMLLLGFVMACLVVLAATNKPSPDELKERVETALAAYKSVKAGETPVVGARLEHVAESNDFILGRSYKATLPEGLVFSCVAVWKVTVCDEPDAVQGEDTNG